MPPKVALLPPNALADKGAEEVRRGGCEVTDDPADADGLVWCTPSPREFADTLDSATKVRWVQLPFAGIERFVSTVQSRPDITWTCAKGIYGPTVAEFALGALITGMRRIEVYARQRRWEVLPETTLLRGRVVVYGGGGIGRSLVAMLEPFGSEVTVVRRGAGAVGSARIVQPGQEADAAVEAADAVVLALALTPETTGLVDAAFLARMRPTAWLVNVARGRHVVTDDLVECLGRGAIGGAVLDVTDPEPLPPEHPLWSLGNCVVTPHVANTWTLGEPELLELVAENSRRFATGAALQGLVDPAAGY